MKVAQAIEEIQRERRSVDFDTYDITVRQIVDMVSEKEINVSPDYQRRFVWDKVRQSRLIESILLGIPIPNIFMATNEDSTWEVIDGLQRVTTILRFVKPQASSVEGEIVPALRLSGMEKIPSLDGATFDDLPNNLKLNFLTRPLRITVLNDKSDQKVRFDLFERLNTGGIILHDQEIRNCVFQGRFTDFIKECAKNDDLNAVVRRNDRNGRGNIQELVLKFFAYFESGEKFQHSVKEFLNNYTKEKTKLFRNESELLKIFEETFKNLHNALPNGIVRSSRPNVTPLVLFEAISIGVAHVLDSGSGVDFEILRNLLEDDDLKVLTTGGTNSQAKLAARIEYVSRRVAK